MGMSSLRRNRLTVSSKADVIVGIQWGDEGKGRIVDYCARDYDVIARFGGGDNAGHSIVVGDRKLALRIVPSGVLQPNTELFIGGGTVVSLAGFLSELDNLRGVGVDISRIKLSDRAHIVFPYHAAQDRANERARGENAIGTTGRGIGPAYVDKVARSGITFGDLRHRESVADRIRTNLTNRSTALGEDAPSEDDVIEQTLSAIDRVLPHVVNGVTFMNDALESGRKVLIE